MSGDVQLRLEASPSLAVARPAYPSIHLSIYIRLGPRTAPCNALSPTYLPTLPSNERRGRAREPACALMYHGAEACIMPERVGCRRDGLPQMPRPPLSLLGSLAVPDTVRVLLAPRPRPDAPL
jgi:hypothetical protein